jgi:pre-mRNA-processing factor 40
MTPSHPTGVVHGVGVAPVGVAPHIVASTAPTAGFASFGSQAKPALPAGWTEHEDSTGKKYYHHAGTKVSQYEFPSESSSNQSTAPPVATAKASAPVQWREYKDASLGKMYYSDGVTTTWDAPPSFIPHAEANIVSPSVATTSTENSSLQVDEGAAKRKSGSEEQASGKRRKGAVPALRSKEEAVTAFTNLLQEKGIGPSLKWSEVAKACEQDPQWGACAKLLSVGERKQLLSEYQTRKANEGKAIARQERRKARESYTQLLMETLPAKMPSFSPWTASFLDVRNILESDERFVAAGDDATRESLFLDFCEEYRKREERQKRQRKREAQEKLIQTFREKAEDGSLTFTSSWSSFSPIVNGNTNGDESIGGAVLSEAEKQQIFSDFVNELLAVEDDKRRKLRDARRQTEKVQRECFRGELESLAMDGLLNPSSTWRGVEARIESLPSFGPVHEQNRDLPRDMFDELVDEWYDAYRAERQVLSRLVHESPDWDMNVNTTYSEFAQFLLRAAASIDLHGTVASVLGRPVSSARFYYFELIARVKTLAGNIPVRRSVGLGKRDPDSSEDEGEIIEE